MRDRVVVIPLTDAIIPVERTHGGGERRARRLRACVWFVDVGHDQHRQEAANTIDSAVLPSSLFLMSAR